VSIHPEPTYALLGAAAVFAVLSLVMFGRGVRQRGIAAHFAGHSVATEAEVTGLTAKDVSAAGEPATLYFPTVRFRPRGRVDGGSPEETVETEAEVIGLTAKDVSAAGEPATLYFPTVRFRPRDRVDGGVPNEPVEAECLVGIEPPPPHVGDTVAIRYDPDHPRRVTLAGTGHPEAAGLTAFVVAKVLLALALAMPIAWGVLVLVVWST